MTTKERNAIDDILAETAQRRIGVDEALSRVDEVVTHKKVGLAVRVGDGDPPKDLGECTNKEIRDYLAIEDSDCWESIENLVIMLVRKYTA
jgi:hypothetical protein